MKLNNTDFEKITLDPESGFDESLENSGIDPKSWSDYNNLKSEFIDNCISVFYIDECGQIFKVIDKENHLQYIAKSKL